MLASSTALEKKKAAVPSARRTMKSPMSSDRKLCGPCTRSANSMRRPAGTRNRRVAARPCARLALPLLGRQVAAGAGVARRPAGAELGAARELPARVACRSKDRRSPAAPGPRRTAHRAHRAATGGRVRGHPPGPVPRPSSGRASAGPRAPPPDATPGCAARPCPRCAAGSARRRVRASRKLNSAVRALPRCNSPVGLGAKRVTAPR